ncbi:50S ribosomal protein L27 [bacterium]|nr:50S ribosomal protein L27 [bacterium]|tara:strand:- start:2395 stop:2670 length:276 start_codon:yes stop_codon:yes gene_type:complete
MSTKRSGGSSKNLRDSQPKYLGVKRADGQAVASGEVIVRQRGTKIEAGSNVKVGRDHTLYAVAPGTVAFKEMRKKRFDGKVVTKKVVHVVA